MILSIAWLLSPLTSYFTIMAYHGQSWSMVESPLTLVDACLLDVSYSGLLHDVANCKALYSFILQNMFHEFVTYVCEVGQALCWIL